MILKLRQYVNVIMFILENNAQINRKMKLLLEEKPRAFIDEDNSYFYFQTSKIFTKKLIFKGLAEAPWQ